MTNQSVKELRDSVDAAHGNLSRQLQGMEPYLEVPTRRESGRRGRSFRICCFSPGSMPWRS